MPSMTDSSFQMVERVVERVLWLHSGATVFGASCYYACASYTMILPYGNVGLFSVSSNTSKVNGIAMNS